MKLVANNTPTAFDPRATADWLFDELARATVDPGGIGVSRESYGAGEQKAIEIVRRSAENAGLETGFDAAANLVVTLPGRDADKPFIAIGSHLDSVPQGGNYDGAAGVVAGLLILMRMKAERVVSPRTVKLIAMRGEESAWYGKTCVGSHALFGGLTEQDLMLTNRSGHGSLGEAMQARGADIARIARGETLLDPASVGAYLELHIEQGPVMAARGFPTAIVTGIRGNIRHREVRCIGEAAHSGAVPRWLRRDAVFAVSELITHLDEHWESLQQRGLDLVVTVGIISTNPAEHAMSRVPGEVTFSFEVRSQSSDTLEAFYHLMRTECRTIGNKRKVEFRFDRRLDTKPARMDDAWVERLLRLSKRLGLPAETLPSGAGHDAAIFANEGVPSAMIFVRNEHGSHNPREAMALDDFLKGADLLYHAVVEAT
ncbi:MAG: Zn-dependent hydrolase [Alphaproteobacteria bacterium]|nr:Zn-dependent hydrolase [Alphaproteobacteria bacterium]